MKKIAIAGMPIAAGLSLVATKNVKPYLLQMREEARIKNIEKLRILHQIANSRGGKCLSKEYINAFTKLKWECANSHRWEATPNSVKQGSWCRKCHNLRRTYG